MELGGRKKAILQAIIDAYIDTAEPVGSRTISKRNDLGLSSATIRNEMADLEELGYLDQPHSSAGRVPSDLGYRFYVDSLMQRYQLTLDEMQKINDVLKSTVREFDKAISSVSKIISDLTQYTSIAVTPRMDKSYIKKFDVVCVDDHRFVVIMVTNTGAIRNKVFTVKDEISEDTAVFLSKILNDHIAGQTLDSVTFSKISAMAKSLHASGDVMAPVLQFVSEIVREFLETDVYLGGVKNIFNYPEFCDLKRARDFMDFLDNKEGLIKALDLEEEENSHSRKGIVKVTIGNENKDSSLKNVSVVRANYKLGDKVIGSIGILGPTRMKYARAISELDYFVRNLNKMLSQMTSPDDESKNR